MVINTSAFRERFSIDEEGKFGHYKSGLCETCRCLTSQVDATMLWDGIPTYLCSNECYDAYWTKISDTCSV